MMKIIFDTKSLYKEMQYKRKLSMLGDKTFMPFDADQVEVFNQILNTISNPEIIVTDSMKNYFTVEELGIIYTIQGVTRKPVSITPTLPTENSMSYLTATLEKNAADEIMLYVKSNNIDDKNFIVISTLGLGRFLNEGVRFVQVPVNKGIIGRVEEIIKLLP